MEHCLDETRRRFVKAMTSFSLSNRIFRIYHRTLVCIVCDISKVSIFLKNKWLFSARISPTRQPQTGIFSIFLR